MIGLVLLVIGLILLPDLSELGVAGLTVKPRPEEEPVLPSCEARQPKTMPIVPIIFRLSSA